MTRFLQLAFLIAAPVSYAPHEDAGVSFFHFGKVKLGERIRFRAEEGAGWDVMPIHVGSAAKGMYSYPLYDQHLAPGGTLSVETSLLRRGSPVVHLTIRLRIKSDRRYLIYAAVQPSNPTSGCMGCIGTKSVPIRGDGSRRLWVYYSFNSISHPIMF